MTLKLKILPRAADDVQCIFDYLAKHSPQGAADWWDAFDSAAQEATRGLVEHPLAPENGSTPFELRQVIFKTRAGRRYRFVFTIVDNELRIVRVRGPGQPSLKSDEVDP
jgi:plasmid stabilization system protein ParE